MQLMNSHSTPNKNLPNHILLEKWIDTGFFWQGNIEVHDFERLCQHLNQSLTHDQHLGDQSKNALSVSVKLAKQSGLLQLSYHVDGALQGVCQRCLSPLVIDVSGDYELFILDGVEQINTMPSPDDEFVFIDEVCPQAGKKMLPIKDLLEDELLLSLPLSLHHDDCEMLINDDQSADQPKENPFAILAQLKND